MADYHEYDEQAGLSRTGFRGALLDYGGWILIGASLGWGLTRIAQQANATVVSMAEILGTIAITLIGLVSGFLFWGLAEVVRRLDGVGRALESAPPERPAAIVHTQPSAAPAAGGEASDRFEEIALLLREVRDISLLTESQRSMRLDAQGKAALAVLQRDVPLLLREHNWIEARNRVQEARERFPTFKEWDELEQKIEQMRAQVETRDVEGAERQIGDLTALGAWDRVGEVLQELLGRHPDSTKANELAQRVRAQRSKAEAEMRARLMAQIQEAINSHNWEDAIAASTSVIQRYPKSPEAQGLRMDLPTMRANLEIKKRKQMESRCQELIKERHYDEALEIARDVIRTYPSSPQAAALRELIPKLEQKIPAR